MGISDGRRITNSFFVGGAAFATALLAACTGDGPMRDFAGFERWDSAGVAIAATSGEVARSPAPWRIDTVPDLQIGALEGAPPYQFHAITGVRSLPNGQIAVVDGSARELRFFDEEGRFIDTVGREGSGPGEFNRMVLPAQVAGDSVVLYDPPQRRFTAVSIEGDLGPAQRYEGPRDPVAVFGGQVLTRSFEAPVGAVASTPDRFAFTDRPGNAEPAVVEVDHTYWSIGAPLTASPSWTVGPDGFLLHMAQEPELLEYDSAGELRRILRLQEEPRSRGAEFDRLVEEWVDAPAGHPSIAEVRTAQAQELRSVPIPTFRRVLADELGWIWAHLYELDEEGPPRWMLFDGDGRARGIVAMPEGLSVHHIGAEHVLGVWRDDLGVEHVRRHRITGDARG